MRRRTLLEALLLPSSLGMVSGCAGEDPRDSRSTEHHPDDQSSITTISTPTKPDTLTRTAVHEYARSSEKYHTYRKLVSEELETISLTCKSMSSNPSDNKYVVFVSCYGSAKYVYQSNAASNQRSVSFEDIGGRLTAYFITPNRTIRISDVDRRIVENRDCSSSNSLSRPAALYVYNFSGRYRSISIQVYASHKSSSTIERDVRVDGRSGRLFPNIIQCSGDYGIQLRTSTGSESRVDEHVTEKFVDNGGAFVAVVIPRGEVTVSTRKVRALTRRGPV